MGQSWELNPGLYDSIDCACDHYIIRQTTDENKCSLVSEKQLSFAPHFLRVLFLINRNASKLPDTYGDT